MQKSEFVEKSINDLFKSRLVHSTAWGAFVFIGLSLLDYISTPENFGTFLWYRIIIAALLAAVSFLSKKQSNRGIVFHMTLAYVAVVSSASVIELMILRFGGPSSPYYVGMILLATCVIGFMPGRFSFYPVSACMIYGIYFFPNVIGREVRDFRYFFMANTFMISVIGTMLLLKYRSEKRLINELGLMYDLREHKDNLELMVKQRTADLADAFSKLRAEVDERRRMDAELSGLNAQLRQSQKMEAVGLLAGGIAHDFSNILATIKGSLYLIEKKLHADSESPIMKYTGQIMTAVNKANNLTHGLLAFSRKQTIDLKPVKINEVIKKSINLLSTLIGEHIQLVMTLTDGNTTVLADSNQIEQVLVNLATNARDAMPNGGTLTVRTCVMEMDEQPAKKHAHGVAGEYVLLAVSDTGSGIEEGIKEKIFEPFFTTKALGKGSGLGLAITYGIVTQHNGSIMVESNPPEGTTFKILLPLVEAEAVEFGNKSFPTVTPGVETILMAEDDDDTRIVMADMLRSTGYQVLEARDGEEAVRTFLQNSDKVDLVLLDVRMPKKNGREACEEMKREKPSSKFLFISGYTADIIDSHGISQEGLNFVSKASLPDEILGKIRQILDNRQYHSD
jgi:signal transduction histidine kinase/ActR/RegA family two-component response regulator